MAGPDYVTIEICGRDIEFIVWGYGGDYECSDSAIADLNVVNFIQELENRPYIAHEQSKDDTGHIDLWIELDKTKLFPWEMNVLGIAVHKDMGHQGKARASYVAEFTLNTAIGAQAHELRETLLSLLGGSGFKLAVLEPARHEQPVFEEDDWHQWTCMITSFPRSASFRTLFSLRETISQAAFLPHRQITTPYLALRMIQLGQAGSLIGYQESEWLECKSVAYELKNNPESLWKYELAVDVAQFANSEAGGLLVIGYRTEKKDGVDTIAKATPVPTSTKRLQMYRDVLRQRIHPPVSRVLIDAYPWDSGDLICLFVPPQKAENQPYLVAGSVVEERYVKSGITIVRRHGDASIPVTAEEIHSTIVAGRAFL
ncbi:MAG TPA: hypothetical protein VGI00_21950, partial [Streptosporangiaceae bacterium]